MPLNLFHLLSHSSNRLTHLGLVCVVATASVFAGCDKTASQNANIDNVDNAATANTATPIEDVSVNNTSVMADNSAVVSTNTKFATSENDDNVVSPNGYRGLTFGQAITPEVIAQYNLNLPEYVVEEENCYFTYPKDMAKKDEQTGEIDVPILYQIIDDKLALIEVIDSSVPFYTGVKVGDTAASVMAKHPDTLSYKMEFYDDTGRTYHLLHNINFKVISNKDLGEWLEPEDIEVDDSVVSFDEAVHVNNIPLQIKYTLQGGQKLDKWGIKTNEWTEQQKTQIKGKVSSIAIGDIAATSLVEGCA